MNQNDVGKTNQATAIMKLQSIPKQNYLACTLIGALAIVGSGSLTAEVSKETLESIAIPNKVETPIGKLEFFDGVPTAATVETVYDNLDRMRAVQVFLDNVGG